MLLRFLQGNLQIVMINIWWKEKKLFGEGMQERECNFFFTEIGKGLPTFLVEKRLVSRNDQCTRTAAASSQMGYIFHTTLTS